MSKNKKKNYNWPPPPDPDNPYIPKQRNPIHSILTALPVIMLVAGLYFYYSAESEQTHSAPIRAESKQLAGVFTGLSRVNSGQQGRHYLWLEVDGSAKGVRVRPEQVQVLKSLIKGESVILKVAPTVPDSPIFWVWHVEQDGAVLFDEESSLQ